MDTDEGQDVRGLRLTIPALPVATPSRLSLNTEVHGRMETLALVDFCMSG